MHQELGLLGQGHVRIAGVDEAGRGAWAGPLTAAAVILPPIAYYDRRLFWGVTDSKKLTPLQRDRWAYQIHKTAMAVGVAHVTPQEIDRYGMAAAGRLAMTRALERMRLDPDHVLVDAFPLEEGNRFADRQTALVRADTSCLAVAAASICAKTARDRLMQVLHRQFPSYGFDRHKGYGTRVHRDVLGELGPQSIHRHSFAPVRHARAAHPDRQPDQ
ncbi:MAG: ribonuclease HII [Chloroflexi bacterium]|nr:ribonuclease HII [Chloroflexota bacterium]HCU72628.1 ribonuclease HII [Chloroflexota bacterium]